MSAGVVIPVKSFARAKGRLGPALDSDERSRIARRCASIVVAAAAPLPVWVVCEDDDVAAWGETLGAHICRRPGRDLNESVTDAAAALRPDLRHIIVAHGDLPLAADLPHLLDGHHGVTLVPDRHMEGTNVIVVDTAGGFRFMYGEGSLRRHRLESRRIGAPARVIDDAALGWDVDEPVDLRNPAVIDALSTNGNTVPIQRSAMFGDR